MQRINRALKDAGLAREANVLAELVAGAARATSYIEEIAAAGFGDGSDAVMVRQALKSLAEK